VQRPTLELVLNDEAGTTLHLTTPTEGMVQELQDVAAELRDAQKGDMESVALAYELTARLMSCNRDGVTVTVEDLRGKYRFDLETLFIFYGAYLEFINEIKNAKN
jgi:hypothetical protein